MKLHLSLKNLLLQCFWEHKGTYLLALVALIFTHLVQSRLPFLAKELALLGEQGKWGDAPLLTYLGLAISIILFRTASRLLFFYPARLIQKKLSLEMIERITTAPPQRYQSYQTGDIYQVIQNDFNRLRSLLGFVTLQIGNVLVAVFVLIPQMFSFERTLIYAFIPEFIAVILFMVLLSRFHGYYQKTYDQQAQVQNNIIESYEGKSAIKNYQVEKSFLDLFKLSSDKELNYYFKASMGPSLSMPIIELGIGFSLLMGAYIIDQKSLGASTLILFSGFVFLLKEPLQFLSWIGIVTNEALAGFRRIKKLVNSLEAPTPIETLLITLNQENGQEKSSWSFTIPFWEKEELFNLSSATISKYVIVGETGHGKTTLLKNLAFVSDLRKFSLSFVSQTPYLFNDYLWRNIFLGKEPSVEEKKEAIFLLDLFFLKDLAEDDEQLLNLMVGENGKLLSGGQAKRVALIRSLMASVDLLFWDDPFSSIDFTQEKKIMQSLEERGYFKGKKLILTTHRYSTVKLCEYAFLIHKEHGILEEGAVEALWQKRGFLFEHFEKQSF